MLIPPPKDLRVTMRRNYNKIVEQDGLVADPQQLEIVNALADLQVALEYAPTGIHKVMHKFGLSAAPPAPRGLYIWGGVGRGKTFLMDLFFESLAIERKKRIHFHRMMSEIHDHLNMIGEAEDPLAKIATLISKDARVLCFDEFFVSDIADAMLLGRLLEALFDEGVTLVATSNSAPESLYLDGLQRERFLPAIDSLLRNTTVLELDGGADYRLRLMQQAGTYIFPADDSAQQKLRRFFAHVAPGKTIENRNLDILGRNIHTLRCAKGVAWFDFLEICDGPRSQNDYIEIARWYQTVIISDIPVLDAELENAARRFISLVDEFYDRRVKLIVSAAIDIESLYQGRKLNFEFERTASRLTEMQSAVYLHEAHIA